MTDEFKPKILDQTLGEVLQNNAQAQSMVMQSMQLNPQQFQQLLTQTGNNQMMSMKIGDLFKNGFVSKALSTNSAMPVAMMGTPIPVQMKMTPEQVQQIMNSLNTQGIPQGQVITTENGLPMMAVPVTQPVPSGQIVTQTKPSLWQRLKNLF